MRYTLTLIIGLTSGTCHSQVQLEATVNQQVVFSDLFETDSLTDYKRSGRVTYLGGQLTLDDTASITRTVERGYFAQTELSFEPTDQKAKLRIWLRMQGATDNYVELDLSAEKTTVEFTDTAFDKEKQLQTILIRKTEVPERITEVTVEYSYGFVRVLRDGQPVLRGYIDSNRAATVQSVSVENLGTPLSITSLKVSGRPKPVPFTADQEQIVKNAARLGAEASKQFGQGKYQSAIELRQKIANSLSKVFPARHPLIASALLDQGYAHQNAREFGKAKPLFERAAVLVGDSLGKKHPEFMMTQYYLARLHIEMKQYSEAAQLYTEILKYNEHVRGENHPSVGRVLHSLGMCAPMAVDAALGEQYCNRSLQISEQHFGRESSQYLQTLEVAWQLQSQLGKHDKAVELMTRSVEIQQSSGDESSPKYSRAIYLLAYELAILNQHKRARDLMQKEASKIRESAGADSEQYAETLTRLAYFQQLASDSKEAEQNHKAAIAITKQNGNKSKYRYSINSLAGHYRLNGQIPEAIETYRQLAELMKQDLGELHIDHVAVLNAIAKLYQESKQYEDAGRVHEQIIQLHVGADAGIEAAVYAMIRYGNMWKSAADDTRSGTQYKRAAEFAKEKRGPNSLLYARCLQTFAGSLMRQKEYSLAKPLYEEILPIRMDKLGLNHVDTAQSIRDVANVNNWLGNKTKAAEHLLTAIELRKKLLGKNYAGYTNDLDALAGTQRTLGHFSEAARYYTEVIALRIHENVPKQLAESEYALACVYLDDKKLQKAEVQSKKALNAYESATGKESAESAKVLHCLGQVYFELGRLDEAQQQYLEATRIRKVLGIDHTEDAARTIFNLAWLFQSSGDLETAAEYGRNAVELRTKLLHTSHPDLSASTLLLGKVLQKIGQWDEAAELLRTTEKNLKEVGGPKYEDAVFALAMFYKETGNEGGTFVWLKHLRDFRKKMYGKNHKLYALSLSHITDFYISKGEFEHAIPLQEQIVRINRRQLGATNTTYANTVATLARFHFLNGDTARAEELHAEVIDIVKANYGPSHSEYGTACYNAGYMSYCAEKHEAAEIAMSQAGRIGMRNFRLTGGITDESAHSSAIVEVGRKNQLWLSAAAAAGITSDALIEHQWDIQRMSHFYPTAFASVSADQGLQPIVKTIKELTTEFDKADSQLLRVAGADTRAEIRQKERQVWARTVERHRKRLEGLYNDLAQQNREFSRYNGTFKVAQLQPLLANSKVAYVELFLYQQLSRDPLSPNSSPVHLAAFVLNGKSARLIPLGPMEDVNVAYGDFAVQFMAKKFLRAGLKKQFETSTAKAAEKLRETVWSPIRQHIGDAKVIAVADKALNNFPFAVLPSTEAGRFLIEDFQFVSVPSAEACHDVLSRDPTSAAAADKLLVVGDIDYGPIAEERRSPPVAKTLQEILAQLANESRTRNYEKLPEFQTEMTMLREAAKAAGQHVTMLTSDKVTEKTFSTSATSHQIIYLSTHIGQPTSNLSGLVLSGANSVEEDADRDTDGVLTASEISRLNLGGVRLVVLPHSGGATVEHLNLAFQEAGVKSTFFALWPLESTDRNALIARILEKSIDEATSFATAYRSVQLQMIRKGRDNGQQANPRVWGAFQLSGDWR